jgi:hypothetical protein
MKTYFNVASLPTASDLSNWNAQLHGLLQLLQPAQVSLSLDERKRKRKMSIRRLAYAMAANRLAIQHETVMPRQFNPANFDALLEFHRQFNTFLSRALELNEICSDTLMAAGIDAMSYTKVVHDALRTANLLDPHYDEALRELDEFNEHVLAEEEEEENLSNT